MFRAFFMVNNLVFRWPKPIMFMVLGAHGIYIYKFYYIFNSTYFFPPLSTQSLISNFLELFGNHKGWILLVPIDLLEMQEVFRESIAHTHRSTWKDASPRPPPPKKKMPNPLPRRAIDFRVILNTLQGINISPKNGILKMIFLFPRWDMLIPWRV